MEVFKADGKGMGLRVLEPVAKGQFIAEYVGEVRGCFMLQHRRCLALARFWGSCALRQKWRPYAGGRLATVNLV